MSHFTTAFRRTVLAGAATLLVATGASAQSVAAVTAPANWTFAGAAQVVVPGMTTPFFAKLAGGRNIVTFSSECSVNAPAGNHGAWVDVDIVLINAAGAATVLAPTVGNADAFCGANGTLGFDNWNTNAISAVVPTTLPAGFYRAQVRARLNGGATGGWFGERSLIVSR